MKSNFSRLSFGIIFSLACVTAGCGDYDSDNYGKYTRAEVRYYAYAPPFIPHDVINPACLDCHEMGLVVDGYKAPVTPHPQLQNCQQCHIRADESIKPFRKNAFVGLKEPAALSLPQPYGPPLIPHRVFMREDCLICHDDPTREEVIQTTHPERKNCQQCHVQQNSEVALFRENERIDDPLSKTE